MKICILTHTFPRFPGDVAAPFMDGVASGIQEAGNEVFVITPFAPGFNRKAKDQNYKIVTYRYAPLDSLHKLGYSRTLTNDMELKHVVYFLAPFMYLFGVLSLLRLVKREKIDIINAHWILPNGFIASVVSKITGVPVVSTLPGSDVYMAEKNFLFRRMARFAANTSRAVTSNSPQLLEDLGKIGGNKRSLFSNKKNFTPIIYGVDPQKFKPDKSRSQSIRKKMGIPKDAVVVLGVGRLVAKKGFRFLIEAAPQVLKENENTIFVVIGEGDQRRELEQLAAVTNVSGKFIFPGWVDYKNLVHYYNLADVFVLPSVGDEEGNLDDQSVSVVEAMACAKPVVTTDFPGYRLVVKDGENGFLTRAGASQEIAAAIIKLIDSPELRRRMGQENRRLVVEKFSWNSIGKQYTVLFEKVVTKFYSQGVPRILDEAERLRIARQIMGVLRANLGKTKNLSCLDVGCSSGVITNFLASYFKSVVGIDVDEPAIKLAQKNYQKQNLKFYQVSDEKIKFADASFDVVVCNQVYNFVDNPPLLMSEIYRVLRPGGICFFSARNKYAIWEPQYNLPFLSWLPAPLAETYLKLTGRGNKFFGKNYLSYWGLRKLVSRFRVEDYTARILENPGKYGFIKLKKYSFFARFLSDVALPLIPNFIWILEKQTLVSNV